MGNDVFDVQDQHLQVVHGFSLQARNAKEFCAIQVILFLGEELGISSTQNILHLDLCLTSLTRFCHPSVNILDVSWAAYVASALGQCLLVDRLAEVTSDVKCDSRRGVTPCTYLKAINKCSCNTRAYFAHHVRLWVHTCQLLRGAFGKIQTPRGMMLPSTTE